MSLLYFFILLLGVVLSVRPDASFPHIGTVINTKIVVGNLDERTLPLKTLLPAATFSQIDKIYSGVYWARLLTSLLRQNAVRCAGSSPQPRVRPTPWAKMA